MTDAPRIIRDNHNLYKHYQDLRAGDIVCCRIRLRPGEEHLLFDLSRRGIIGVPSLTSQMCSRSKCFQARLYGSLMIPGTTVIYTIHGLLDTVNSYARAGFGEVVVKLEGRNAGLGVLKYRSIEDVYSQSALGQIPYPYVVQPLIDGCRDLRIIALADYWEAYERHNPDNFRHNLHCGGVSRPAVLTQEQRALCTNIMAQADFAYAHIDLLMTGEEKCYFAEINLRGGLRGAQITPEKYQERLKKIERECCAAIIGERA